MFFAKAEAAVHSADGRDFPQHAIRVAVYQRGQRRVWRVADGIGQFASGDAEFARIRASSSGVMGDVLMVGFTGCFDSEVCLTPSPYSFLVIYIQLSARCVCKWVGDSVAGYAAEPHPNLPPQGEGTLW